MKPKNIFKKVRITLFWLVMLIALIHFVFSCTPQKRLNRLVKNHPELIKSDTTFITKTINVPEVKIDTVFKASQNVEGLNEILNTYSAKIDSLTRVKLASEVKNYIINRPCLDAPVTIHLKNGAWCKVSQTGNIFSFTYLDPPKQYTIKVPAVVMQVNAQVKNAWRMFAFGVLAGWGLLFLVIQCLKPKQNG